MMDLDGRSRGLSRFEMSLLPALTMLRCSPESTTARSDTQIARTAHVRRMIYLGGETIRETWLLMQRRWRSGMQPSRKRAISRELLPAHAPIV